MAKPSDRLDTIYATAVRRRSLVDRFAPSVKQSKSTSFAVGIASLISAMPTLPRKELEDATVDLLGEIVGGIIGKKTKP